MTNWTKCRLLKKVPKVVRNIKVYSFLYLLCLHRELQYFIHFKEKYMNLLILLLNKELVYHTVFVQLVSTHDMYGWWFC